MSVVGMQAPLQSFSWPHCPTLLPSPILSSPGWRAELLCCTPSSMFARPIYSCKTCTPTKTISFCSRRLRSQRQGPTHSDMRVDLRLYAERRLCDLFTALTDSAGQTRDMVLKSEACLNSYTDRAFRKRRSMIRADPESHKPDASEPVNANISPIDVFMPRLHVLGPSGLHLHREPCTA
jgi:hypothetical protein